MKLDLKRFKKIDSDDKITTLQHENGHQIKIYHKGLSDEHRDELEKLPVHKAKGGLMSKPSKPKGDLSYPKASYTEPQDLGTPDKPHKAFSLDTGAKPCINPSCKSYGMAHPNCKCYGLAEGGKVDHFCSQDNPHTEGCEYFKGGGEVKGVHKSVFNYPKDKADEGMSSAGHSARHSNKEQAKAEHEKVLEEMKSQPKPKLQGLAEKGVVEPQGDLMDSEQTPPPEDTQPAPEESVPQEMAAADQAVDKAYPPQGTTAEDVSQVSPQPVAPQAAPQPVPAAQQPEQQMSEFDQHKNDVAQQIFPEAQAFKTDLDNGHIQAKTYKELFHDKSTLGKIGTLFGLLVGGAGSGLSGQPNMLMGMMDKEIERDLDAQKTSSANKQNFLKINQQNTLNKAQANLTQAQADLQSNALARVQMNWASLHYLVDATSKLPPGPQRDQMMQTLAMMNQGVQTENFNILDRAATAGALSKVLQGNGSGQNTMMMKSGLMGPEASKVGEDIEQKTIPGVPGKAQRPIPEQSRSEIQAMDVLSKKAADLMAFAKAHKGTLSPSQRALGAQKAAEMVNFYNSSLQGGILTQGRLNWLDGQIGKNPTSIFQDIMGNNKRLDEIKNSNDMRRGIVLKNLGFPEPAGQDQTKMMHGSQYKKVEGGWQKVK